MNIVSILTTVTLFYLNMKTGSVRNFIEEDVFLINNLHKKTFKFIYFTVKLKQIHNHIRVTGQIRL